MEIVFTDVVGFNDTDPPTRLPDGIATSAQDVLFEYGSIGRRRPSMETVSLTSGPSATIYGLFRHQPAASSSAAELWAFSGTSTAHRRVSGTWNSVSASDTVSGWSGGVQAVTLNGKLFIAYDSNVNRLHVWDGSSMRRVGIESDTAATVANTGAGAYAAVLRYYKIQWKIKSGSNVVATSELSPSVSFTPSGAGTAARVTKPTTADSATHWVVFGSADDVNYYDLSGDIAVGTTTYDDSAATTSYSGNTIAPTAGLSVPPPSAKYLATDGNRLLMAGCWETSATSYQTATRNSRVWFSDVIGARDNTGEDESIPQTTEFLAWIDVGENDGDVITGMVGGPVQGVIYVFKQRSVWRLSPTGLSDSPYRADRVVTDVGAVGQHGIAVGTDGNGAPAVYFQSLGGPFRLATQGLENIGLDLSESLRVRDTIVVWDPISRIAWWLKKGDTLGASFQPDFERRTSTGVRAGWATHTVRIGAGASYAATMYEVSAVPRLHIGGGTSGALATMTGTDYRDLASASYPIAAEVASAVYQPQGLARRISVGPPTVEYNSAGAVTHTVSLQSRVGGPTVPSWTSSDTTTATVFVGGVWQETLHSVQASDVGGVRVVVTWDLSLAGVTQRIHSVTVPWRVQERA